ncbi:hypothetical protein GF366_00725 [Candidatus Peregrinibacteria bacterium]|nr:hypothetical protein [Candidatus Peregrinibacteria bacterium]
MKKHRHIKKKKYPLFKTFLDEGEEIVNVAHRHFLIWKIDSSKTWFFGIILPVFGYFLFPQALIAFIIWGGVGVFGLIYHFIDWYYDAWILTNYGVIDIERNGFFDITTTRIEYHMIEGTSYTVKGFWQTLFNFGDIIIDKLGAQTHVVLKDAYRPKRLERLVMKCQEKYVYERSIRDHNALKDMLSDMIAYHVQNEKIENKRE